MDSILKLVKDNILIIGAIALGYFFFFKKK